MMAEFDVMVRYAALEEADPALQLYALVDGLQFETFAGQSIQPRNGVRRALFAGTEDAPLAQAGPWLIAMREAQAELPQLVELERARPAVSWLITAMDLDGLALVLQLKLDAEMPDGKKALLRFYDPRVLFNLFNIMTHEQRVDFFGHIEEWHFLYEGRRYWTGRNA